MKKLIAVLLLAAAAPLATAQDYPAKPIRLIIPFQAGIGVDASTRQITSRMTPVLGQPMVIENRPGAATIIGTEYAAKAAPDGYTLYIGASTAVAVIPYLYSKLPYNIERDFAPITQTSVAFAGILMNPELPVKDVRDLIALSKKRPLNIGTIGNGSNYHLFGGWFALLTGADFNYVHYNTSAPVIDVVAGRLDAIFDGFAAHSGNPELLQFLLDKDANPNANKAGYAAIHAAILRGDVKAVEVLLNHGADPNAKLMASTPVRRDSLDYYFHPGFVGATPFWLAARFSQPAMMRLLAAKGADPGYVHTVSFWGRRGKDSKYTRVAPTKVTPMLAALGMGGLNSVRAPLPNEREAIALESIKIAVEAGAPVEAADQDGRTALEVATALRYKSVIDYLTSKGAKLDRPARPLPRVRVEEN